MAKRKRSFAWLEVINDLLSNGRGYPEMAILTEQQVIDAVNRYQKKRDLDCALIWVEYLDEQSETGLIGTMRPVLITLGEPYMATNPDEFPEQLHQGDMVTTFVDSYHLHIWIDDMSDTTK